MSKDIAAILIACCETIREVHEIPAGHLYAGLMMHYPSLSAQSFNNVIASLVNAHLVKRDNSHLLTWIGPIISNKGSKV